MYKFVSIYNLPKKFQSVLFACLRDKKDDFPLYVLFPPYAFTVWTAHDSALIESIDYKSRYLIYK